MKELGVLYFVQLGDFLLSPCHHFQSWRLTWNEVDFPNTSSLLVARGNRCHFPLLVVKSLPSSSSSSSSKLHKFHGMLRHMLTPAYETSKQPPQQVRVPLSSRWHCCPQARGPALKPPRLLSAPQQLREATQTVCKFPARKPDSGPAVPGANSSSTPRHNAPQHGGTCQRGGTAAFRRP